MVKVVVWTSRRFGVQHHRQSVAMKGKVGLTQTYFSFHGYRLTMVLNTETSWSPNYYLYHRICLTINKIVYYQHLLVSLKNCCPCDWVTNPVVKVVVWTSRRFGVQHHRQSVAMKGKVGLIESNLLFLSWLPTDDGVEHRNVLKSKLLPLPPDLSNHQ